MTPKRSVFRIIGDVVFHSPAFWFATFMTSMLLVTMAWLERDRAWQRTRGAAEERIASRDKAIGVLQGQLAIIRREKAARIDTVIITRTRVAEARKPVVDALNAGTPPEPAAVRALVSACDGHVESCDKVRAVYDAEIDNLERQQRQDSTTIADLRSILFKAKTPSISLTPSATVCMAKGAAIGSALTLLVEHVVVPLARGR